MHNYHLRIDCWPSDSQSYGTLALHMHYSGNAIIRVQIHSSRLIRYIVTGIVTFSRNVLGAFHLVRTHLGGVGGWGQASYTFPLRITCKKGEGGGGSRKHVKLRTY